MKRLALLALLSLCASSCTAASLTLSATAPSLGDTSSDCAAPVLVPYAPGLVRMNFQWWAGSSMIGPPTGTKQVIVPPGVLATMTASVPPGIYSCNAIAADSLGNQSCVSGTVTKLAATKLAKVTDLR